ncbi:MAG: RagB/SusD family nutrient uptake outer membrane protein [Prevotella sp.]|nr:RagB/SusD family nutrient uptake outer membrane protein [Prevotella sp.]
MNRTNRKSKTLLAGLGAIIFPVTFVGAGMLFTACSDMLDTTSELVEFAEDNTLDHPTDSVYSVLGIVNRMQIIADRTVLLGEVRSDLVETTEAATADMKRLAAFDFSQPNKYNQVSDYYAVINNCNYYLANVDSALQRRGRQLFKYEYAAVKAFRAWAYLELVKNYGQVPFVTQPVLTEREAEDARQGQRATISEVCDYFIADLTPYALVDLPQYGTIGSYSSQYFFIPMRALLGDLCLWAGHYTEAARWYNSYLNDEKQPVEQNPSNRIRWTSVTDFQRPSDAYSVQSTREYLSFIPMEERVFDGTVSELPNIFQSTQENNYFYQLTPSAGMRRLSASQIYCMEYKTETTTDTVYVPRTGLTEDLLVGDLRLYSNFRQTAVGGQDEYSEYNTLRQTMQKLSTTRVLTYRSPIIYLRYAEALNRAGYPQSAMCILKHGLCDDNAHEYIDSLERVAAGSLISFDATLFTKETTLGIHSRGAGDANCNAYYSLPMPDHQLASRQDTINYQIPLVEDLIVNELALEGAFEGYRFHDLMRVALRRGDPAYLADPISRRGADQDGQLRALLMDTNNWYLPLQ